jgi:hypothetical protein
MQVLVVKKVFLNFHTFLENPHFLYIGICYFLSLYYPVSRNLHFEIPPSLKQVGARG